LFPIIPPRVARLAVATSGPNISPSGASSRFSWSSTTPGCTATRRPVTSTSPTWLRYFEQSSTTPGPIACPDRLVPAPRAVIGTFSSAAIWTVTARSSTVLGTTTPSGWIW
jgi:hypothetical protein